MQRFDFTLGMLHLAAVQKPMEGPWQRSGNVPAGSQALRIVTKGKESGTFPEEKARGDVGTGEQSCGCRAVLPRRAAGLGLSLVTGASFSCVGGSHAGLRGLTQGPESFPRSKDLACLHTSKTSECSYVEAQVPSSHSLLLPLASCMFLLDGNPVSAS